MGKEKKTESYNNDSGSYNYKLFKCFNRKFKINEVTPTDDVRDAFCQFAVGGSGGGGSVDGDSSDGDGSSGVMGAEQLCCFLDDHQGESGTTVAEAQRLIDEVIRRRRHVTRFTRHGLDLDDFFNFLFYEDLNPPITPQVRLKIKPFSMPTNKNRNFGFYFCVFETGASRYDSSIVTLLYIHRTQFLSYG